VKRIAVVSPNTLVARELRERLAARPDLCDEVRLLSGDESEVGQLASDAGGATFVGRFDEDSLEDCLLAVFCGTASDDRELLSRVPEGCPVILLSTGALSSDGAARVAGVGRGALPEANVWVSAHPAAYGAALLLSRLESLEPRAAQAVAQLPVSMIDEPAIDALFEQTRALLAFQKPKAAVLPRQLAFNFEPADDDAADIANQVRSALGSDLPFSCHLLRAGVFHGVGLALRIEPGRSADPDEVRRLLAADPRIEVTRRPETVSPVALAGSERLRVAPPILGADGSLWLWAAYDNLTRSGALNALELAEELLASGATPA